MKHYIVTGSRRLRGVETQWWGFRREILAENVALAAQGVRKALELENYTVKSLLVEERDAASK